VNGTQAGPALKEFTVTNSNNYECDTWSATIALNTMPSGFGAPFWALAPMVSVQLLASLTDGGALQPLIGGLVDDVTISEDMQTLDISGRDFSAPLIEAISNDKFVNQTSSQVATKLAQRRGLVPQVTATTTQVGRFLADQTGYMAEDISEFRILAYLAQQEGFDFYVKGKMLYFGPPQPDNSPFVVTYSYATGGSPVQANATKIQLKQKKLLAGKTTVQVRSWSYQNKAPTLATWQAVKTQNQPVYGPTAPNPVISRSQTISGDTAETGQFYIVRRSGLTQQQSDALAQKVLADITSNERSVEIDAPAVLNIDARRTLRLTGTRTAFDQDYTIQSVKRTFGWEGTTMSITGKSSSAQSVQRL
jgi:phage protein D